MGLTSVELLIDISPMKISYSGNVIDYGYTDFLSASQVFNVLMPLHIPLAYQRLPILQPIFRHYLL